MIDSFPSIRLAGSGEKPPRRRHLRCGKIIVAVKLQVADVTCFRRPFDEIERTIAGRGHLDRGAATLTVTLSKMPIAYRKECAGHVNRHPQGRAFGQLLD